MALKDTDLLAVYRATGETAGNYSASQLHLLLALAQQILLIQVL